MSSRLSVHHSLEYRTRLIQPNELDLLCRINHELFSRSPFSAPLHAITERNLSIFEVNALSFALVEAKVHDAFVSVGMSSILPLNRYGESVYCLTGGLKDIELRGHHIAAPGEWSNAVLIFIVGFTREVRGLLRDRPLTAIAHVVFDHGSHIISSMRVRHPERRNVRLLAQTNRSVVVEAVRDFEMGCAGSVQQSAGQQGCCRCRWAVDRRVRGRPEEQPL